MCTAEAELGSLERRNQLCTLCGKKRIAKHDSTTTSLGVESADDSRWQQQRSMRLCQLMQINLQTKQSNQMMAVRICEQVPLLSGADHLRIYIYVVPSSSKSVKVAEAQRETRL